MPNLDDLNLSPLADALIVIASQMLVKADQVIATQPTQRERVLTAVMTAMLSGKQLPLADYDKIPERAARLTDTVIEKINQRESGATAESSTLDVVVNLNEKNEYDYRFAVGGQTYEGGGFASKEAVEAAVFDRVMSLPNERCGTCPGCINSKLAEAEEKAKTFVHGCTATQEAEEKDDRKKALDALADFGFTLH